MFANATNSKKQGDIGLSNAIAFFVKEGYTVSIPLTDSQDYDLIIDNGLLQRIQVKTTSYKDKKGYFTAGLSVKGGNRSGKGIIKKFDKNKVDGIFILTSDNEQYFLSCEDFSCTGTITIGKKYLKYRVN